MATLTQIPTDVHRTDYFVIDSMANWGGRRLVVPIGLDTNNIQPTGEGGTSPPPAEIIDYVWGA